MGEIEFRKPSVSEWESTMAVAWKTFLRHNAADYQQEGIDHFFDFITDERLRMMFVTGEYPIFVAVDDSKIIGMISARKKNHLSLLFVDPKYHRRKIATKLVNMMVEEAKNKEQTSLTVHASPYAIPFYENVGFEKTGNTREEDGIIYTPMKLSFKKQKAKK